MAWIRGCEHALIAKETVEFKSAKVQKIVVPVESRGRRSC